MVFCKPSRRRAHGGVPAAATGLGVPSFGAGAPPTVLNSGVPAFGSGVPSILSGGPQAVSLTQPAVVSWNHSSVPGSAFPTVAFGPTPRLRTAIASYGECHHQDAPSPGSVGFGISSHGVSGQSLAGVQGVAGAPDGVGAQGAAATRDVAGTQGVPYSSPTMTAFPRPVWTTTSVGGVPTSSPTPFYSPGNVPATSPMPQPLLEAPTPLAASYGTADLAYGTVACRLTSRTLSE
jgi:hypothetical protein